MLENTNRPPYGFENAALYSCLDGRSDSQHSRDQAFSCTPPIYHTVYDEKPIEEQLYAQAPSSPSLSATSQSQEAAGPIYQDVAELSMSTNATSTTLKMVV